MFFFQTEATGKALGFQAELEDVDTLGSDTVARTLLTHATASSLREVAMHFFLGNFFFGGHEVMSLFFLGGGSAAGTYSQKKHLNMLTELKSAQYVKQILNVYCIAPFSIAVYIQLF